MTLSPALATIVGAKKDEKLARSEIVKRLWAYLKEKNLQVEKYIRTHWTNALIVQPQKFLVIVILCKKIPNSSSSILKYS